ncbi:MAG TPA: YlxM family DNA-binding protein [Bacillota bacterium]|nr:YlxM family DNA-binding protein [Bacillota bacterium]
MEEFVLMNLLLDFYGQLLTDRQQDVCRMYYEENLSLAEIGTEMKVTRQAVHDMLRRAGSALNTYEEKLGLVKRFQEQQKELKRIKDILTSGDVSEAMPRLERLIY